MYMRDTTGSSGGPLAMRKAAVHPPDHPVVHEDHAPDHPVVCGARDLVAQRLMCAVAPDHPVVHSEEHRIIRWYAEKCNG